MSQSSALWQCVLLQQEISPKAQSSLIASEEEPIALSLICWVITLTQFKVMVLVDMLLQLKAEALPTLDVSYTPDVNSLIFSRFKRTILLLKKYWLCMPPSSTMKESCLSAKGAKNHWVKMSTLE